MTTATINDDEFEALARFAAQTRQQPQEGEAQNISMLDIWAAENADLLSKVQTVGSEFTAAEQGTLTRWIGQDPELLRSLLPDEAPKPAAKNWLNGWMSSGWQNWALITLTAGLIGYGVWERAIAFNASNSKPLENVASKNIEIAPSYVPTDEALKKVIRTPTPHPEPIPTPVVQATGNATVVVPSGFDSLTVRNSDGLGIGFVEQGDRVTVIRDDGGDRVVIKTPELTGSVVSRGIRRD